MPSEIEKRLASIDESLGCLAWFAVIGLAVLMTMCGRMS